MLRKNKILFALILTATVLASTAFFFIGQNRTAEADLQKSYLTIDVNEMRQMQKVARDESRPLDLEIVRVEGDIAVVRATENQITQISEHGHEEFHKCGGFIAHATEADALATIENFARADNDEILVDYTINNATTVQPLINGMVASNIVQTITTLSAYNTRYYNSPMGLQSATWIKNNWATLAQGRSDVTVEFFTHSFQQPSVILTISGTAQPNEVVVLGAHQDSIRSGCVDSTTCQTLVAPGADDDASGIASLTEVIRVAMASNYRPAKTVKFMAFAGEERGLLGSAAIAANFQTNAINVIGMMQLDMTNYRGSTATDITLITDFTNAAQNQFLRNLMQTYLPTLVTNNGTCGYGCSDHAAFNSRGFPASFPHESAVNVSNPNIHKATDTLANSDTTGNHSVKFSKLAAAFMAELAKGSIANSAIISGRITNAQGQGIGTTVLLTLTGGNLTEPMYARATPAGYFRFQAPAGQTYTVTPVPDERTFTPANRQVTLSTENIFGVDFITQ
jgi:leucyl aminopeptidase